MTTEELIAKLARCEGGLPVEVELDTEIVPLESVEEYINGYSGDGVHPAVLLTLGTRKIGPVT